MTRGACRDLSFGFEKYVEPVDPVAIGADRSRCRVDSLDLSFENATVHSRPVGEYYRLGASDHVRVFVAATAGIGNVLTIGRGGWVVLRLDSMHSMARDAGSRLGVASFQSFPVSCHFIERVLVQTEVVFTHNSRVGMATGTHARNIFSSKDGGFVGGRVGEMPVCNIISSMTLLTGEACFLMHALIPMVSGCL
jgi:hypothetical protein